MIFASELPTDIIVPSQAVTIVIVFCTLLFVLNIVAAVWMIVGMTKRKPAIEAEFATKQELHQLRLEIRGDMDAVFVKINSLITSFGNFTNTFERDLGRIEGKIEGLVPK